MQPVARRNVLGDHDDLREEVVRELDVERKVEADRAASDIGAPTRDVGIVFQHRVELGGCVLAGEDRGVLRQGQIDHQLGAVGRGKELPWHVGEREQRHDEAGERHGDRDPAHPHGADEDRTEGSHDKIGRSIGRLVRLLEHPHAEQRREQHRDEPGDDERDRHHGEDRERVFAGGAAGETDRHKARDGHESAGQHRQRQRLVGVRRRGLLGVARRETGGHDVDRRHGVVDEKAEGDDERAERNALQVNAEEACMIGNTIAIVSGIDSATTAPGRKPRLTMLTAMMMAIACQREAVNSLMAVLTTTG